MIYLDASAVVKLAREERGSAELSAWLDERTDEQWTSSTLIDVELVRALRRNDPSALTDVPRVLSLIYRVEVSDVVRATAAAYADPTLRSLDAIHLASAQTVASQAHGVIEAFIAYDRRLAEAAGRLGMNVISPGVN